MWPNPLETADLVEHVLKKSLMENFIFCADARNSQAD